MGDYLRQWPALLVITIVGAAFGLFFTAGCTETGRRCLAVTTPGDVQLAVIVGAVIGIAVGALVGWGRVHAQRQKEGIRRRFPGALIFTGVADELTRTAAKSFRLELAPGETLVGVVSVEGIQVWVGSTADRLLADVRWQQIGEIDFGDPNGDVTQPTRVSFDIANYQRVSVELTIKAVRAHLQFPIHSETHGSSQAGLGDAYDIRKLIRRINGYREVASRSEG